MKRLFSFLVLAIVTMAASQSYAASVETILPSKSGDGDAIYSVTWSGEFTTTYTASPYSGISATYVDTLGIVRNTSLTFIKGSEVLVSPYYPVNAGVYTVIARPLVAGDSLDQTTATATLTILPASLSIDNSVVVITKFYDGTDVAAVSNTGILNGLLGNDMLHHYVEAHFDSPSIGSEKDVTVTFSVSGSTAANYVVDPAQKVLHHGAIIEDMRADTTYGGEGGVNQGIEVAAYGYCAGSGSIVYHLISGNPDQYKLDFDDPAIADVAWTNLTTPGPTGTIDINIPVGIASGDYTASLTFRDQNYPSLVSPQIRISLHVNLPETYVMPLFDDVIALIDTCHCLTDVQWYHREVGETTWNLIPGANDYVYQQVGGLTGEYFASCKMNGVDTYTCPQQDLTTLITDNSVSVKAYPNPSAGNVTINITNSRQGSHQLSVINDAGVTMESRTFDGYSTTIDMSTYHRGRYIIIVDGYAVKIVRN
ncbi:MAG: hypothetical protein J6X86_00115 [Bacteroidales bacterium]|nr:hypothetical protein [Bacteroidales bacterium]